MEVQQRPGPGHAPNTAAETEVRFPTASSRPTTLATLPHELQLEIISHLPYPDALSLKLTSHHFCALAAESLTVLARVSWLLDRARSDLPIPKSETLQLRNDALFLENAEVQKILKARRRHEECADAWRGSPHGGKWPGCLVVSGVEVCDGGVAMLKKRGIEWPRRNISEMRCGLMRSKGESALWGAVALWRPDGVADRILKFVRSQMWQVLHLVYMRCDIFVLQIVVGLLVFGVAVMLT